MFATHTADRKHNGADRQVDEEDPAPAEPIGERPAEHRPDRDRSTDRRSPEGDRRAAGRSREVLGDQRERRREHRRAADALERAGEIENEPASRDAAEERGERENADAGHEHALAPDAVGDGAGREQQRCQRERIRVKDPLETREAGVQVVMDPR
jgi:hypothetical protein